jgi:GntR family transcriptional regulator
MHLPEHVADVVEVVFGRQPGLGEQPVVAEGTPMAERDTGPGGIYSRLADSGHGPVRFTEDVSTRMPTPEEADFLRLTPPQPVFFLVRIAFDTNDRPVETCEHIMSGDRWQLSYAWTAD